MQPPIPHAIAWPLMHLHTLKTASQLKDQRAASRLRTVFTLAYLGRCLGRYLSRYLKLAIMTLSNSC